MNELTIVLPLYNPPCYWTDSLSNSLGELDAELHNVDYSVIIVNDGSTCLDERMVHVLLEKNNKISYFSYPVNRGKGYAIRYGLSKAESEYYIYTDLDFPFGFKAIKTIFLLLKTNNLNLVLGKREEIYYRLLPFKRNIISGTLRCLSYLITGFKISDSQAGVKGIDNKAKGVFLGTVTNGFLFELEFIRKCIKKNLRYSCIEVKPRHDICFSNFSLPVIFKEIINLFKILYRN